MATPVHPERLRKICSLFDEYIEMYASRDERLTQHFGESFSGYTGGGQFLVKDRREWVEITLQDFAQVPSPIRIDVLDLSLQDVSHDVVVATAFFQIHLPIPDAMRARETARLVLIFRLEGKDWKIVHSGNSIPYPLIQEGEIYPLKGLQHRNDALETLVQQRTLALRESESRMRNVLDATLDAVVTMDALGKITGWNNRAQTMFGWTAVQAVGRSLQDTIVPPRHRTAHQRGLTRFLASGETRIMNRRLTMTALRRNGEEFPIDMSISSIKTAGNYEFNAFIADTSERKKKEEALGELTHQLRESEALYRLLTEDALDVIWKTDCDLHLTYVSPADERLRGFRADEMIGRHLFEMFAEESATEVQNIVAQSRKAEQPGAQAGFFSFSVQHRSKDGRLIWGEVLSKPERDDQGLITGHHGITREITERKQLEDQVHQLAFYDPLTQLPNRRLLDERLTHCITASKRSGRYGALMFIDLDNFKPLNDTHGHVVGQLLLVEAAAPLSDCVREVDTVSRFGGDEFVVLLSDLDLDQAASMAQCSHVAEKIRSSLATPYLLRVSRDGEAPICVSHRCSASIGVALFVGADLSQDEIFKRADAAMYQAKDAGRNLYRVFNASA